ncbi:MAG: hypothetical protein Q7S74_03705 [Nanoarchaeota archaeon]|nr:hypothetical protein [Nanoarchaeota archaeon]
MSLLENTPQPIRDLYEVTGNLVKAIAEGGSSKTSQVIEASRQLSYAILNPEYRKVMVSFTSLAGSMLDDYPGVKPHNVYGENLLKMSRNLSGIHKCMTSDDYNKDELLSYVVGFRTHISVLGFHIEDVGKAARGEHRNKDLADVQ